MEAQPSPTGLCREQLRPSSPAAANIFTGFGLPWSHLSVNNFRVRIVSLPKTTHSRLRHQAPIKLGPTERGVLC